LAGVHEATEEYLETILELEEEGIPPIRARLAERLGISAASVTEAVRRLAEQGYVEDSDDRALRLTTSGRHLAVSVVRRHRLAERLLVDVIGLEWEKVHREAARWEHAISADVEHKLVELLGDPATCPHGNPIPGNRQPADTRPTVTLAEAPPGPVTVTRISEQLEVDDDVLVLLARARLIPGCAATVVGTDPSGVAVSTPAGTQVVPPDVAALLWVSPTAH
jgi:DtxR family Mn-dependent transcriptional regulator